MNKTTIRNSVTGFFKNDKGDVVIWQRPNVPLLSWLLFKLLSMVVKTDNIKQGFSSLSMGFLFTWAYLEITNGESYFRRTIGVVVLAMLIVGFFR